jgi:anti-sigma factor RsiW
MNRRDLELLSSYLDGQLKLSDAERARLEARLASDASLRAVLEDLRATRGLLRKLPMRKAPRNFTLTPQMVGKNPPLPRSYPAFRFVTALASMLLFFTMGVNFLVPQMASQPSAFGMGGGGAPEVLSEAASAATEAPVEPAAEEPSIQMAPLSTPTTSAEDTARNATAPSQEEGVTDDPNATDPSLGQNAPTAGREVQPPVPPIWQLVLAGIVAAGAIMMVVMRRLAADRWRQK